MKRIKSLGVFCGAANGVNPQYVKDAEHLGTLLAENDITLVYGAGHVGMMGAVAKGTLDAGGKVIGVINTLLQEKEEQILKLSELKILSSLHLRKEALFRYSDAYCVLPGGLGTLDEIAEIMTLKQLGEHDKPIILYNANGFWEPYRDIIDSLINEGYMRPEHAKLVTYVDNLEDILPAISFEINQD